VKFAITVAVFLAFFRVSAAAQGLSSAAADDGREVPSMPAVSTASVFAPPFDAILTPSAPIRTFTPMPVFAPMASAFVVLKTPPPTHKFFDVRDNLGLSALASSLLADALSTQKGLAYPGFHEMNPIARPFVQTRTGAAGYTAGSFALLAGAMYAAHKTHHHKLEHILPFAVASWETALSARNYHLIATNKK
jgi:hypothetical protein